MWFALAIGSYFIKPLYPFLFLLFAVLTTVMTGKLLTRSAVQRPRLSLGLLKQIGLWSYSLYLLHQPLLNTYSLIINWLLPPQAATAPLVFLLILCSWLIIVPFSKLWHDCFELPGIAWGKQIIQKSPTSAAFATGLRPNKIMLLVVVIIGTALIDVKLSPATPEANNNQAWALATDPDVTRRNGNAAVKLAEDACRRTHYQETLLVGTLAAAYAEAGRFDDAIATAQKACALATQATNQMLLSRNQELLNLYLNHQPYHESDLKTHH